MLEVLEALATTVVPTEEQVAAIGVTVAAAGELEPTMGVPDTLAAAVPPPTAESAKAAAAAAHSRKIRMATPATLAVMPAPVPMSASSVKSFVSGDHEAVSSPEGPPRPAPRR